jgi:acyl-CoA thioesterase I
MVRGIPGLALVVMIGCQAEERNVGSTGEAAPPSAAAAPAEAPPTVLMLGTSLTAGYGLQPEDAYPALVQRRVEEAGLPFRIVNAGVSGETSAGALRRLDWLMRQEFDVLLIETGANDMLRGMDLDTTRANIQAIIDRVREERRGVRIVLAGMLAPPNLGREYVARFGEIYPELAERNDLPLIPFLLADVGGLADMNQPDGIHPNEEGAEVVAANVWEVLGPVLHDLSAEDRGAAAPAEPAAAD